MNITLTLIPHAANFALTQCVQIETVKFTERKGQKKTISKPGSSTELLNVSRANDCVKRMRGLEVPPSLTAKLGSFCPLLGLSGIFALFMRLNAALSA